MVGIAEVRIVKEYEAQAETYKDLGLTTEDGAVIRALKSLEGSDKIFAALDKAVDFLSKEEHTKEVGHGKGSEVVNKSGKTDVEDNHAKIEELAKTWKSENPESKLTHQAIVVQMAHANPELCV